MTDKPYPNPHRQTLDDLDPESATTDALVAMAHAHRAGEDYPTGEVLLGNLPKVLRALCDHVLTGQATALDVAYRVASIIEAVEGCGARPEPPHPIDAADALRRWPFGITGKAASLTPEVLTTVERLRDLRTRRAELDAEAEALELRIKEALGDAEALVDSNGSPICTWRSSTRSSIDTTALKAEMPEIAARFTKESSTRTFRLNKAKEIF